MRLMRNVRPRLTIIHCGLIFSLFTIGVAPSEQTAVRTNSPRIEKVENAGLLFTDNPAGVSGTDAGYSLPLGEQTLWLFGDVFLLHPTDPAKPYVGGVSNCALLVPAGHGTS